MHNNEYEYTEETSNTKSVLAGLVIGGLVGAGAALLFAPQAGEKTRSELQHGALELRDRTQETVKETITQAKSKANQIKADVQIRLEKFSTRARIYSPSSWIVYPRLPWPVRKRSRSPKRQCSFAGNARNMRDPLPT